MSEKTLTVALAVRHGQSLWNADGRWQGHADPDLSELGRRQALVAADAVGMVDAIIASDLLRAAHTAAIIGEAIGIGPVLTDERLRERDAGEWTGLTKTEIAERWPSWLDTKQRPAGFESVDSVYERVSGCLADLAAQWAGATLLLVTHGGVLRTLEKRAGRTGDAFPNLAGIDLQISSTSHVVGARRLLLDDRVQATINQEL